MHVCGLSLILLLAVLFVAGFHVRHVGPNLRLSTSCIVENAHGLIDVKTEPFSRKACVSVAVFLI